MHEYILGFEVAVDDTKLQKLDEPSQNISEHTKSPHFGQILLPAEEVFQVAVLAKFLDDVIVVGGFEHVEETHDVLSPELLHDRDFPLEPLHQVFVALDQGFWHHFDGNDCFCLSVKSLVDLAEGSLPNQVGSQKDVLIDFLLILRLHQN